MEQHSRQDRVFDSNNFVDSINELAERKRDELINNWENRDVYSDLASYLEDMTMAHGYDLIIYSKFFKDNSEKYIDLNILDEELIKTIAINVLDLWLKDKPKINTEVYDGK